MVMFDCIMLCRAIYIGSDRDSFRIELSEYFCSLLQSNQFGSAFIGSSSIRIQFRSSPLRLLSANCRCRCHCQQNVTNDQNLLPLQLGQPRTNQFYKYITCFWCIHVVATPLLCVGYTGLLFNCMNE